MIVDKPWNDYVTDLENVQINIVELYIEYYITM